MSDYHNEAPEIIRDFLSYHETIKGHSQKTVDEYFLDLRVFFRYLKIKKQNLPRSTNFSDVSIKDIDLDFVKSVTLSDVYEFLTFLSREREINPRGHGSGHGLSAASRARKIATIRSYYKYLTIKTKQLSNNPVQDLDSPKSLKSLPRYLSLDESKQLLSATSEYGNTRDYCIVTLFLNCGLRISELVGINISDIAADSIRILGKGNKERIIYLNDACVEAINAYALSRKTVMTNERQAFFLSNRRERISKSTVHALVKKHLLEAGLDSTKYSSHKLRHTAATLMLRGGVDIRTLQELLGHEHLNTTQIYTHVESDSLREAAQRNPLSSVTADANPPKAGK